MEFIYIDEQLKQDWEKLVQRTPSSGFMQSFFWSEFKRETDWETFKIGLKDEGKLIAGASILKYDFSETQNFLYIPEGPVLDYSHPKAEEYFHAIMGEVDKVVDFDGPQKTSHTRINPHLKEVPSYFDKFRKAPVNMEPQYTVMVNLNNSEDELLKAMKPKGRYNIKLAEKSGVTVRTLDSDDDLESFFNMYEETYERNDFEGQNRAYLGELIKILQQHNSGKVFLAEHDKDLLAAAIVIVYGARATYFFGASKSLKREKMAPYKLHWEAIKYAKSLGAEWYDFWGVSAPDAQDHPWSGISQFKRKFGVQEFEFIGCYDFIYDSDLYNQFLKESGEAPESPTT